jgi:hypothetical protein
MLTKEGTMSHEPGKDWEVENRYMDYLEEANRVFKKHRAAYLPFMIVGLLFICIGVTSFLWAGYRAAAWLFWLGLLAGMLTGVVGMVVAAKRAYAEADEVAEEKPGFDEFFKLHYRRRYWPKQIVPGEKYERFLSIIGRKGSA